MFASVMATLGLQVLLESTRILVSKVKNIHYGLLLAVASSCI